MSSPSGRTSMTSPIPAFAITHIGLLAVTLLAPAALAQDAAWKLPARGYAVFDRTTTVWRIGPSQEVKRGGLLRPVDATSNWRVRSWRAAPVADGFQVPGFDDGKWGAARMPMQTQPAGATAIWPEAERVLDARVVFEVPRNTKGAVLTIEHEDDVTAWLNGVRILEQAVDGARRRTELVLPKDVVDLFEQRQNVLSVQVRNASGASYLDVQMIVAPRAFTSPENALARVERDRADAQGLRNSMFSAWRAPAVLCEGELDPARKSVARAPVDLRDLGAFVAFDLSRAQGRGKLTADAPLTWKFGDVRAEGRAEAPDAEGRQRITLRVSGAEPNKRRYESRFYEHQVLRWWELGFEGELIVDRWFDTGRGVVTKFDSRLTGTVTRVSGEDADRTFELEFAESWTLKEVRESRDARFSADVVEAIKKGTEFLRKKVEDPTDDGMQAGGEDRTYPSGRLALALLAMIHAEVPRDDVVLVRGLDELRRRVLVDTYSVANAIMAIEAFYRPLGEYEELRSGAIDRPRERRLSASDLTLVREWTDILLHNMDTRVDRAYLARWNYVAEARYDHSVNQYGLLGLYSAHLCGIEISPQIWRAAAAHLIGSQQKPGRRISLELATHRQVEAARGQGTSTTSGARPAEVAGWGYVEAHQDGEPRPIYGSMTCAGLTGLTIAMAGMLDSGRTRDPALGEADDARRRGFAWLAENFTARWHPGPGSAASYYTHHYYYLYGLERACELSGTELINGRDWYLEGALALLAQQEGNGAWPTLTGGDTDTATTTAMAVLFLKKSSMPVYTQR